MRSSALLLATLAVVAAASTTVACSSAEEDLPGTAEQMQREDASAGDARAPRDDAGDGTRDDAGGRSDAAADAGVPDATADAAADAGPAEPPVDAGPAAFTKAEVQALFDARCTGCHGGAAGLDLDGDFTLDTVGVAATQLPTMKRIAPGDRTKSYLFHKVSGTHAAQGGSGMQMPRGGPFLAPEDVERLGRYIDAL